VVVVVHVALVPRLAVRDRLVRPHLHRAVQALEQTGISGASVQVVTQYCVTDKVGASCLTATAVTPPDPHERCAAQHESSCCGRAAQRRGTRAFHSPHVCPSMRSHVWLVPVLAPQSQQNACRHERQTTRLQPPFFSTGTPHLGHGLTCACITRTQHRSRCDGRSDDRLLRAHRHAAIECMSATHASVSQTSFCQNVGGRCNAMSSWFNKASTQVSAPSSSSASRCRRSSWRPTGATCRT
jgi:hypothetical protein